MNSVIELSALLIWLYADLTIKVIFLIVLICAYRKGMSLPKPHKWLYDRVTQRMSQYRMKHYPCDECENYDPRRNIFDILDENIPCYGCTVSEWFLWRPPSSWQKKVGRDGVIT